MIKKNTLLLIFVVFTINTFAQNIEKKLLYNEYTLDDSYKYKDTIREFQWKKIAVRIKSLDSIQAKEVSWVVLQNYKNINGAAPAMETLIKDDYDEATDLFGVRRSQSIPLYLSTDLTYPNRYTRDGTVAEKKGEEGELTQIRSIYLNGDWYVPTKYAKNIETKKFSKAIFIDLTNQNIATLEKQDSTWLVRSMNPITTGRHKPPYAYETPTGIFTIQSKTPKMVFFKDGTNDIGGFAPYASRFSGGAYLHGIPVNAPSEKIIEYSSTLGTTPRSHMCVRNATSHAKFLYDWATIFETIVFVFK